MKRSPTLDHALALLMAVGLVHGALPRSGVFDTAKAAPPSQAPSVGPLQSPAAAPGAAPAVTTLPPAVGEMREAILEAVHSGRLEDLAVAVDLNELKPELAATPVPDAIAYWRSVSADGSGRDLLALLGVLLESPFAVTPLGRDPENTRLFVWPTFADRPLATLTPEEDALLARLESTGKVATMMAAGRYTGWRVVIGGDGVWHSFRRYD